MEWNKEMTSKLAGSLSSPLDLRKWSEIESLQPRLDLCKSQIDDLQSEIYAIRSRLADLWVRCQDEKNVLKERRTDATSK